MKTPISVSLIMLVMTSMMNVHYAFGTSSQQKDQNLIEKTCKNTQIYALCIATLRADPKSASADVTGLALIMVGAVESKSKEALSAVNKLIKGGGGDRKMTEALKHCKEVYKAVLEGDVPVARRSVYGVPKYAETAMADAAGEADVCEDAFGGRSPLTKVNAAARDLAVVARAIIRNLL